LDSPELRRRIAKLRKSLDNFSKNSTVDWVHDLRARTRRVESMSVRPDLDRSGSEKLLDGLKSVRKKADAVRDMDVKGLGRDNLHQCRMIGFSWTTSQEKCSTVIRTAGR
jgi:CHAD domain-containing protein